MFNSLRILNVEILWRDWQKFYFKHSCITIVLDSCIPNKLVFESGSWAGNEYHSRSVKRSDSSLQSSPGVFPAPQVVCPGDFLISPPACADVCEKDYFKLNDELFFFFLFPLLKHMDIFQTGGCKRAVKTRSRLFTRYFDENLWRWPSREAAAAQRTIFDCVHQRHLVLQLHSLVITGPHPNVRHLCSIPSPLST